MERSIRVVVGSSRFPNTRGFSGLFVESEIFKRLFSSVARQRMLDARRKENEEIKN